MINIICDLDGTLAMDRERAKKYLHQVCEECAGEGFTQQSANCIPCKGNGFVHHWDLYFDECDKDLVNPAVAKLVRLMYNSAHRVLILTGRNEIVREKTEAWLDHHQIPYHLLKMRPSMDRTQDDVMKIEWGKRISPPDQTLFVLEDRQRVVNAWRAAGYNCFQVAPGDF